MTSPNPRDPRGRRHVTWQHLRHLLHRVGHYGAYIGIGVSVVNVVLLLVPDVPGWAQWAGVTGSTVASLTIAAGALAHARRLCDRCLTAMPLDAQAKAERWNRSLTWFHALVTPQRNPDAALRPLLILLPFVLVVGVLSLVLPVEIAGDLFLVATYVAVAVFAVLCIRHDLVRPWCPFCHWPDGGWGRGPEEPSPVRPPTPIVSR